jgi:hypothetical protein
MDNIPSGGLNAVVCVCTQPSGVEMLQDSENTGNTRFRRMATVTARCPRACSACQVSEANGSRAQGATKRSADSLKYSLVWRCSTVVGAISQHLWKQPRHD